MHPAQPSTLRIGTRQSDLALWQTNHMIDRLQAAWPGLVCQITPFVTMGDQTQAQNKPLPAIGGKGLFTAELEHALRTGEIDIAVHSLKDLPVEDAPGLTLGAIASRADVRDVLVARNGWTLATLPPGALVGTSSTRRMAQLLATRPDLKLQSIRGNVGTRIRKVMSGEYDATVLAAAGVERLNLLANVSEWLSLELMLPAPGQGALAVQCRADDVKTRQLLAAVDDAPTRAAVTAERQFLHTLGGGCSAPVAAYATVLSNPISPSLRLQMYALVAATDGSQMVRVQGTGDAATLGTQLAQQALDQGGWALLDRALPAALAAGASTQPAPAKPLQGKRILVTRAREQVAELCEHLACLGAQPIALPLIQILPVADLTPLDCALQSLQLYDWIVFTSTNTVRIVGERWRTLLAPPELDGAIPPSGKAVSLSAWSGIRFPEGKLEHPVQIAAVGPATAAALRQFGVEPSFVPDKFIATEIIAGLGNVAGQRILLPQAELARQDLAERLMAAGALVDALPIYQTLPAAVDGASMLELQVGLDIILFTSGSTIQNFMTALDQHGLSLAMLGNPQIACIGPVTAQTAQALGLTVDLVAEEHTVEGLVAAVVKQLSLTEESL